jgi:MFS family permease
MSRDSLPVTTDGRLLTDRLLYRGLRVNIIAGALGMAWVAMTQGMPLMMFMEALGASGVLIGSVMTMLQLSLVMQIPGAFFASRLATRRRFWAAVVLLSRALWFVPAVFLVMMPDRPLAIASAMVWLAAISAMMGQSVSALWYSWMADLVPDSMRGRFWGIRQSWVMVTFLLAMWIAGYVLDVFPSPHQQAGGSWMGYIFIFSVGAALGCLDIIIHLWVPEPKGRLEPEGANWLSRLIEPMRHADFRRLTIAMGIQTFSVGLVSLGIVYLKKNFHITYSHLAAITIASSLGTLASSFVWGYVMDRIGGRAFGAAMLVVAPIPAAGWFFLKDYNTSFVGLFKDIHWIGPAVSALVALLPSSWGNFIATQQLPQSIWILLFTSFIAGAIFGGIGLCQMNMSGALAPTNGRTMAMGVHWCLVGLIGAFGAFCAGNVMDYFTAHPLRYILPSGTPMSFHHVLIVAHVFIIWLVVLPILLRIRRRKGEPHLVIAVSQLFLNNPLRAFSNIYKMASAVSSRERARAAHSLGKGRTALAVADLIEKLEDSSSDVREEAALALGSIGSPEAVAALIVKLDDSATDIAPRIATALRLAKDRAGVDALLRRLGDPDRETKSECIRALGEIRDRRAVPPLMDILSQSSDMRIASLAAEALARLHELPAVYKIVPRMRETRNAVLRRSLAVAVGDLIGEPEEFYRILSKEQKTHGAQIARLLRRIRREIKRAMRRRPRSDRAGLLEKTHKIEWAFEKGDLDTCVSLLFELALDTAMHLWNVRNKGDIKEFVAEVSGHDTLFGAAVWYLDQLRQKPQTADTDSHDHFDILLGVYFLASRRLKE